MTARQAENWDDDFVFSLPVRTGNTNGGGGSSEAHPDTHPSSGHRAQTPRQGRHASPSPPAEDEDWDAELHASPRKEALPIGGPSTGAGRSSSAAQHDTSPRTSARPSSPLQRSASQPLSAFSTSSSASAAASSPPTSPRRSRPAPITSTSTPIIPSQHRPPLLPSISSPERVPQRRSSRGLSVVIPPPTASGLGAVRGDGRGAWGSREGAPLAVEPVSAREMSDGRGDGMGMGWRMPLSARPGAAAYPAAERRWVDHASKAMAGPSGSTPTRSTGKEKSKDKDKDKGMLARVSSRLSKRFSTAPTGSPSGSPSAVSGVRPRTPAQSREGQYPPVTQGARTVRPRQRGSGPGHTPSASVGGQGQADRYFAGPGVPLPLPNRAGSGASEGADAHAHKLRRVSSQQVHARYHTAVSPLVGPGTPSIEDGNLGLTSRQVSLASATSGTTSASSPLRTPSPYGAAAYSHTHAQPAMITSRSQTSLASTGSNPSAYRLPTSGSSTSVGYHLPSPSPASPYHPSRRGMGAGSVSDADLGGWNRSRSRVDLGGPLEPEAANASKESLDAGQRYFGQEQPCCFKPTQGYGLNTSTSMSTMGPPEPPETSRFSMDSATSANQRTLSRNGKVLDDQGQAIRAWRFGSAQEAQQAPAGQSEATTPTSSRNRKISLHRALRRLGTESSLDNSPKATEAEPSSPGVVRSRSTIKRLGSFSRKHTRKVSDGWRLVSGTGSTSTDQDVPAPPLRQEGYTEPFEPLTPRAAHPAPHLPPASADPRSASMPIPTRISSHASAVNAVTVRAASGGNDNSTMKVSPGSFRRSSMGDLRIPSRVVSSQKGIKEGIDAVKQFSAGIIELQALVQQRKLLDLALMDEAAPDSAGPYGSHSHPSTTAGRRVTTLARDYAQWWDMADVLIDLADTGKDAGGGSEGDKKGRRVTLAATPSATQKHTSSSEDPTSPGPPTPDAAGRWHATTGRQDLSQKQLKMLKDMLSPRQPSEVIPIKNGDAGQVPASEPPLPPSAGKRTSRSAVFFGALKGNNGPSASQNRKSDGNAGRVPATPKTPRRPSLANLFRRTPSTADLATPPGRMAPMGQGSPRTGVKDSPLSDWDHLDSPDRAADAQTVWTTNGSDAIMTPVKPVMPRSQSYTPAESPQPGVLALTPDNLPGLLKYLRVVLGRCKEHLREMERIKAELRSTPVVS